MGNTIVTSKKVKTGADTIAVNVLGYVLVGLFALICMLPFYLIVIASFTSNGELIRSGFPLIPKELSVEAYHLCIKNPAT
nr:carbohydrate ABC transporter permease [Lachnospiraceae bacterium]